MKGIFRCVPVLLFIGGGLLAQNPAEKGGELTVPWEEFKRLLNLDDQNIILPIATFHKMLAQSGQQAPPHSVQAGNVT